MGMMLNGEGYLASDTLLSNEPRHQLSPSTHLITCPTL